MLFRAEAQDDPCTGRIGLADSEDGVHFTPHPEPVIVPQHDYEAYGCEDPRLVRFGDTYVLTYVGNDGRRGVGHIYLATSTDLQRWEKHGLVLHPREGRWNSGQLKAAVIAPVRLDGRYAMFYLGERRAWETAIGLAYSNDLLHWQEPQESLVLEPRAGHFDSLGAEPILAPQEPWERRGRVKNVVFSEGLVRCGRTWYLYYGAADTCIGLAVARSLR